MAVAAITAQINKQEELAATWAENAGLVVRIGYSKHILRYARISVWVRVPVKVRIKAGPNRNTNPNFNKYAKVGKLLLHPR